jgi:hypothetical protein
MNLEESDALVGIAFLQMPATRGRIIRLDVDALDDQPTEHVGGDRAATIRPEFEWSLARLLFGLGLRWARR